MKSIFLPLKELTFEQYREIFDLQSVVWPPKEPVPARQKYEEYLSRSSRLPEGFSAVYGDDGELAAAAFGGERIITTDTGELPVLALGGVCSDPQQRGRGYGAAAVKKIFSLVTEGQYPVSLFQTSFKVEPFYINLGARRITNRIINSNAADRLETVKKTLRQVFWDDIVMIFPGDAQWPSGTIDIRGPGY